MKTTEINKIIDIKLIDENPQNPRTEIGDVSDLEASIKAHGLIQPITVRPVGKRYQVVAGSRRFTALKNLKFTKIACNIREIDDKEAFEIATTENITRKDMDPADECMAVARMLDDGNDIHTVASHFGRHPRWVIGRAKMARLGGTALEMLKDGTITLGHAEALTMADDKDIDRFLKIAGNGTSPDALKNIIMSERKNLANAKFDTYKICKNCPKQSVKQQDIFGDITDSYCLDGECFMKNVANKVEQIRKQFLANGFKECPEEDAWQFDYGYYWVDVESEESLDEDRKFKVKWLRANGFKAYYKIDESDASYKFKWNLNEYQRDEGDDEDSGSEQDERESLIKDKAEDLADEEEEGIIKDRLRNLLLVANDDFCAMILDILDERIEIETTGEDGEKETEYDTYLNHVGEGENGLTPKQTVLEKLTYHYSIRYNKNDARNFFGLGDESEYQKRVEANMKKAEKLVDAEDKESEE